MREEKELMGKATVLKVKLMNRARRIEELVSHMAKSRAGLLKAINPERLETMEMELDNASGNQHRDALMYATLRYALGFTDDIEPDNLALQE